MTTPTSDRTGFQAALPRFGAYIAGDFVPAESGETFDTLSPVQEGASASLAKCSLADVDRAVRAARSAFDDGPWPRLKPSQRKAALLTVADRIEAESERFALLEAMETGKPLREARRLDVAQSVARLRWYAELADKVYGEVAPTGPERLGVVTREPVGVVAAIVPWNFPLMMAVTKIAPALTAGNAVILKPAEASSLTALALAEAAAATDLPCGILQVLPGHGATCGRFLAEHQGVDAVTFTGSTPVGARIMGYAAASNLKRVSLECGGKSPHLVLDPDRADPDMIEAIAWGVCYNQGQVCDAGATLILVGGGHERLIADLADRMARLTVGDPLDPSVDLGSMISGAHLAKVHGHVERALEAGANLVTGGEAARLEVPGAYYRPTLLTNVAPGSEVAREEVFGPVLGVVNVRTEEEAISLVNRSRFGLAAAVWSGDQSRALKVAGRLRVGSVAVNSFELGDITTPFGGFRQSGIGRDRSAHALANYTELKTSWIKVG